MGSVAERMRDKGGRTCTLRGSRKSLITRLKTHTHTPHLEENIPVEQQEAELTELAKHKAALPFFRQFLLDSERPETQNERLMVSETEERVLSLNHKCGFLF